MMVASGMKLFQPHALSTYNQLFTPSTLAHAFHPFWSGELFLKTFSGSSAPSRVERVEIEFSIYHSPLEVSSGHR